MSTMPYMAEHRPLLIDGVCSRPSTSSSGICGLPLERHRVRGEDKNLYMRRYNREHPRDNPSARIIGIDGEGQGRRPHRYFFLAAADEMGNGWQATPDVVAGRLTTRECLDFILDLPRRSLIVGYAFIYDLTKILQDLTETPEGQRSLFLLFHEELRARKVTTKGKQRIVYKPVRWEGYRLNFMNRRFTVSRGTRSATVWDIFRFFQGKFTKALIDWKIADVKKLERMSDMKEKRATFDQLTNEEIHAYCKEECEYLASLARGLLDAHEDAGLKLKHYYGAGSTASAFLEKIDVRAYKGEIPEAMREPVACAFFGGRFENSVIGPIRESVWNYDISSAYPYQATHLPCLSHGVWRFDRLGLGIAAARLALVNWTCIGPIQRSNQAWGPLPVRATNGTIVFPLFGKGGWTWKEEYLAALKLNPQLHCKGAWLYETDCDCAPFHDIPTYYRERVRLGKDAKGIVLKLGTNSIYGKLAQSKGLNPPFQSWVWAGNITSGCRAQLLELLSLASNPWNVLMLATDGLFSRERLTCPAPRNTQTGDLSKPLGGWEEKRYDRGIFAVRPGIYFPIDPTDSEMDAVRARGLGKKVLYSQWPRIVEAFEQGADALEIRGIERFVGAKSGLTRGVKSGIKVSPDYGEWVEHPVRVTFHPKPKRESINPDRTLEPMLYADWESEPYKNSLKGPEAIWLEIADQIAEEQPDADFSDVH